MEDGHRLKVGDEDIGCLVKHLEAFLWLGVKSGYDVVGGEDDVSSGRAEGEIHAPGCHLLRFDVEFGEFSIPVEDGSASLAPDV